MDNEPREKFTMVVSPVLYPEVHKHLYKREIQKIGRHYKYEYQGKTWWEIYRLPRKRPFNMRDMIRYSENDYWSQLPLLPKAMRKRGYRIDDNLNIVNSK